MKPQTLNPYRPAAGSPSARAAHARVPLGAALLCLTLLPAAALLGACSGMRQQVDDVLPDRRVEYKKAREAEENLELPPDLASAGFDDALDIPGPSGSATFSGYSGERDVRHELARSGEVLPEIDGVRLERAGDERWLEIDAPPKTVWSKVSAFWREQGILLEEEDPTLGVMRTDWLENRAEIRDDIVTNVLRKVVDGLYATSTRDQYRVRIEPGAGRDTADVHLTHRAMEERLVRNSVGEGATTVWEPAPSDRGKEAVMLRRLMLYLGVSERSAERMLAQGGGAAGRAEERPAARLETSGSGAALVIPEEYRRAWRQTGLALDRSGFAVEDRDRSAGVFYVRYDDPNRGREKKGLLSKLAFWQGGDGPDRATVYQVRVEAEGDQSRVTVRDQGGAPEGSETASRILALLEEQMR